MKKNLDHAPATDNRKAFWICLAANLLVAALLMACNTCAFEKNDDNYISAILFGAQGPAHRESVYINRVLGGALKLLIGLAPGVQWYAIFQCVLLVASFTALTYILWTELKALRSVKIGIFLLFLGFEAYVRIQFTKTAGLAVIAAVLLLVRSLFGSGKKLWSTVSGCLLFMLGFMLRKDACYVACAALLPVALCVALPKLVRAEWREKARMGAVCIFLCVTCLGSYLNNQIFFRSREWEDYRTFNSLRRELTDYGFPDYDLNEQAYLDLGISRTDYDLYRTWNYADPEEFTPEKMKALAELRAKQSITPVIIVDFAGAAAEAAMALKVLPALIFLFALFALGKKKKRECVLFALSLICIGGMEFYLFLRGRAFLNRVDFIFYCLIMLFFLLAADEGILSQNRVMKTLATLAAILVLALGLPSQGEKVYKNRQPASMETYEILHADADSFYIIENSTQDRLWTSAYRVFGAPPAGILANSACLGGWQFPSPYQLQSYEAYGIRNIYRDMVDNPSIYLVADRREDWILTHIREHYAPDAELQLVRTINRHPVYRVVTHGSEINTDQSRKEEQKKSRESA